MGNVDRSQITLTCWQVKEEKERESERRNTTTSPDLYENLWKNYTSGQARQYLDEGGNRRGSAMRLPNSEWFLTGVNLLLQRRSGGCHNSVKGL